VSQAVQAACGRPSAVQLGDWIDLEQRTDEEIRTFLDACCEHLYRAVRTLDLTALTSFLEVEHMIEGHEQRIERRMEASRAREQASVERRAERVATSPAELERIGEVAREELLGLMTARAVIDVRITEAELLQSELRAMWPVWRRSPEDPRPRFHPAERYRWAEEGRGDWLPGADMRRWCPQSAERVRFHPDGRRWEAFPGLSERLSAPRLDSS
jgi:hypothetical protein